MRGLGGDGFEVLLDGSDQRQAVAPAAGPVAQRRVGGVRGKRGQRQAPAGHRLERGAGGLALAEQAGLDHAAEHAVARGERALRVAVGPAALGQLRQGDEERGLGDGEALRLLAEPGERGGAQALEIAAIGRQRQVALQDIALGKPALDLDGAQQLAQLARQAAAFARLDQPGKLHRQRRAAGDDASIAGELQGGTSERQEVDAAVVEEALVLVGDQHVEEARVDLVERRGEAPAALRVGEGAQQRAVAVGDLCRQGAGIGQRRRVGAVERFQRRPGGAQEGDCRDGGDGKAAQEAGFRHRLCPRLTAP